MFASLSTKLSMLLAGALATVLAGLLGGQINIPGIKPIAEICLAALLFYWFPERPGFTLRRLCASVGLGLALGATWILIWGWKQETVLPAGIQEQHAFILLGYINAVISAPIFEEKVLRHLWLHALCGWTGPILGCVLVSLIFALAHFSTFWWAFAFSILMCWLALRGASSFVRAVIHAVTNAVVLTWQLRSLWVS